VRTVADERGSATVIGACVVAALAGLVVLIVYVGAAVSARHQAQSAADLGALAAAQALMLGEGDPCGGATMVTVRMDARVRSCTVDGSDVVVRVEVGVDLGALGQRQARAVARAGPAE
jgi:secretion/DNA translocation related TadE-like protein